MGFNVTSMKGLLISLWIHYQPLRLLVEYFGIISQNKIHSYLKSLKTFLFFGNTYLHKARFPLYTFILNWLNAEFDKKFQFYPSKADIKKFFF